MTTLNETNDLELGLANDNINTVSMFGKIDRIYHGCNVNIIRVRCGLYTPSVIYFDNSIELYKGDHVEIRGNIQSSARNGKRLYTIFANEMRVVDTIDRNYFCCFEIKGQVALVQKTKEGKAIAYMRTYVDKHGSTFPVVLDANRCPNWEDKVTIGDMLHVVGGVQTGLHIDKFGGKDFFQDYIVTGIL